jgi:uncharacterized Zn finger protein
MASHKAKTWWGQRFLTALSRFSAQSRLERGRRYASANRILAFKIEKDGRVQAIVRGNVNPYFGVTKEPRYQITIHLHKFTAPEQHRLIDYLGTQASFVIQLLMNEMPHEIDTALQDVQLSLLPSDRNDFDVIKCSCPDFENPCKHIAGVYYYLAQQLDRDPFLLFELRGVSRTDLQQLLMTTSLGQACQSFTQETDHNAITHDASFFTQPHIMKEQPPVHQFWQGTKKIPTQHEPLTLAPISAILVKKGGDFPAFWESDASFIETMEAVYERVRKKSSHSW